MSDDLFTKHCESCGAAIRWITTDAGHAHPVDAKPEKRWLLDPNGHGRIADAYLSHFATCPKAAQHRRPR